MPKIIDVLLWPFEMLILFLAGRIIDRLKRAAEARDAALAAGASEADADAVTKQALFGLSAD